MFDNSRMCLRCIGADGSMGLKKNRIYETEVYFSNNHICVKWALGLGCPYSSTKAFALNWEIVR